MDSGRDDVSALVGHFRAVASPLRGFLRELHERYRTLTDGQVADYIPELSKADPNWFGISIVTVGGQEVEIGDALQPFTIQSISKPFVYGMALTDRGREATMHHIGVEPSGDAFNSIELQEGTRRPFNPMVNAGAIAAASLVTGEGPAERLNHVLDTFARYIGHPVQVDMAVFTSERATGHRNRAMAHLMRNFDIIDARIEEALDLYFQQCSILVTCRDLAVMAATLANGGVNPRTGERALAVEYVRDLLSVMYTCGMYDYAGEWAYRVGLPAKSGVGGGILAVVPGQAGIGIFSPPLDSHGNSVRGLRVCEDLVERFGLHVFDARDGSGGGLAAALSAHGGGGGST
ncbi:MAG: glutaminase A [Deltaproteobacteria bacterium]|nr:glutaminase A [Deltaproteobacteria bacterium]